jgi:hypothetical protein
MPEAVAPAPDYDERPGRWVAERRWPPAGDRMRWLLDVGGLVGESDGQAGTLVHGSGQTVGLDAGAWCAYGNPADLPTDQRREDALSLSLDSAPTSERIEIFGTPTVTLRLSSDRPVAFVVARLCDVAPDGASTLITRGVLNLCHRDGHDHPRPLEPGRAVDVELALKSIAYALPAGHRLRLAISTSYWPWLWPSPAAATLTISTGGASSLSIPVRVPSPEDAQLPPLERPESAPPLPVVRLRQRRPIQTVLLDAATGGVCYKMSRDFSGAQRMPSGLEYDDHDPVTFTIIDGDPLSARVRCERRIEVRRADWRTRIELLSEMTADASDYLVTTTIEAYEADTRIHARTFTCAIPRDHT